LVGAVQGRTLPARPPRPPPRPPPGGQPPGPAAGPAPEAPPSQCPMPPAAQAVPRSLTARAGTIGWREPSAGGARLPATS
jgi:hypothetical protein